MYLWGCPFIFFFFFREKDKNLLMENFKNFRRTHRSLPLLSSYTVPVERDSFVYTLN